MKLFAYLPCKQIPIFIKISSDASTQALEKHSATEVPSQKVN
jgi:hypothetical protein